MLESLETRRLFSVIVSEAYPGFYEVHGDNDSDDISVTVSMNEESFTLEGNTYYGVGFISIHSYGGDDTVSVISVDGAGYIAAAVSSGEGDDIVTLNFDGSIWAGSGADILYLTDSFRGQAFGESGDDRMYIVGACVDPEIIGGSGDDLIDCSQNYYGVVVRGGSGSDTIYGSAFDDLIYGEEGSDSIVGGGGNDVLYTGSGSDDQVDGGNGYDIVYLHGGGDLTALGVEEIA
ncbi:MAG: hypothetical protein ABIP55_15885 [Tepidisphaeraceae bacterium]